MIKENLFDVALLLSKLDRAYNNAEDEQFKRLWLAKWNEYAEQNTYDNFKPRDYDFEQKDYWNPVAQ